MVDIALDEVNLRPTIIYCYRCKSQLSFTSEVVLEVKADEAHASRFQRSATSRLEEWFASIALPHQT